MCLKDNSGMCNWQHAVDRVSKAAEASSQVCGVLGPQENWVQHWSPHLKRVRVIN